MEWEQNSRYAMKIARSVREYTSMAKARHTDLERDPGCTVKATVSLLEGK